MDLCEAESAIQSARFFPDQPPKSPPPQVLLDGSFIHMALQVKMDILDRVKKLLLGEAFKCFVPR